MYRVAFPTASETDEHAEMAWVDRQHDTAAAGHEDEAHRLTGTVGAVAVLLEGTGLTTNAVDPDQGRLRSRCRL